MLIFLDLETTGLEEIDKICSIAVIVQDEDSLHVEYDVVNEGKKIGSKASSINHITNEMLKNKPKLEDSKTYKYLQEHNNKDNVLIAHNIKYDLKMLDQVGFKWYGEIIDTLRCTKHLIAECEQFSLQFLRYELQLYKQEIALASTCSVNIQPHNALSDALHVKLLYQYLYDISSLAGLLDLSSKNVLMQKLEFGKYSGRYIEDISMNDRGYLEWMLGNILDLDEDLRYSIDYYLQGN